jgi:hypothetical protein
MMNKNNTILGKRILVGLTYLNRDGEVAEQLQLHGVISQLGEHTLCFERADGAGEFSVPFDGELDTANPDAIYTLRSTGKKVSGVEYIGSWTIHPNPDAISE